jgi:hypothetical protein
MVNDCTAITLRRAMLPIAAVLLLAGCQGEPMYCVRGQVTMPDGTPVAGGQVEFRHHERPISAIGYIQSDGTFELSLNRADDGTLAGDYRIALSPPPPPSGLPEQAAQNAEQQALRTRWLGQVPARYQSPETSGLAFTVSPDRRAHDCQLVVTP